LSSIDETSHVSFEDFTKNFQSNGSHSKNKHITPKKYSNYFTPKKEDNQKRIRTNSFSHSPNSFNKSFANNSSSFAKSPNSYTSSPSNSFMTSPYSTPKGKSPYKSPPRMTPKKAHMKSRPVLAGKLQNFKRSPECLGDFPPLKNSENHTVLFEASDKPIEPLQGKHVPLPCCIKLLGDHWDNVKYALTHSPITSTHDLEERIGTYCKDETRKNMQGLHYFFQRKGPFTQEFFDRILPFIVDTALQLPDIVKQPMPLLKNGMTHKLTISKHQAASILCNMFLCTFPTDRDYGENDYNQCNFSSIHQLNTKRKAMNQKMKTLIHYFDRISKEGIGEGNITYERVCLSELPKWSELNDKFKEDFMVVDNSGMIENEGIGMLQADFANEFIGGGVLNYGLVQEEIRFIINPECLVSMVMCERMHDNEAIIITGTEQYSTYTGYSNTYAWSGPCKDDTSVDPWNRKCCKITAIDAICFWPETVHYQFKSEHVLRELNKAHCGFHPLDRVPEHQSAVATGNWGCGAFGGNYVLKAVIQMMVCCHAKRQLVYFTFNDFHLKTTIETIYKLLVDNQVSIGKLWNLTINYTPEQVQEFGEYLIEKLKEISD